MRLKFRIQVYASGVLVKKLSTGKQGRVSSVLNRYEWDECHLRVIYGEGDLENSGIYTSTEEAKLALTAFTEQELVSMEDYAW